MKVGIIGSGMIAQMAFECIRYIDDVEITALYCREVERDRAAAMCEKYGVSRLYTDYEEFLKDSSFDTAYCGLINNMHYEYMMKAMQAGKNAIVEKPFASTSKEAREMYDLAKEKNLFIFEMVTFRYFSNYEEIIRRLPELGEIKMLQINQSQYSRRYDAYLAGNILPVLDPAFSGGALYDLNVYGASFTIGLLGRPQSQTYFANMGYNGIDTSGCLILKYPNALSVCMTAKDSASPSYVNIQGTKGYIHFDTPAGVVENLTMKIYETGEEKEIGEKPSEEGRITIFRRINEIIENRNYEKCYAYMDKTMIAMEVLEQARLAAGIHFAADEK